MPGQAVVFQEGPVGANDESAPVARVEDVALVCVPPVEHVSDVGVAHNVRKQAEATRLMVHWALEI